MILPSLPTSIQYIIDHLRGQPNLKPADVVRIIQAAKVQEADLLPWADYDHPIVDSYGRKLVYQGANFEVMVMSWVPGDMSTIHDHGYTQWGAVQVFGQAEHATFRLEQGQVKTLKRWQMQPGEVVGVHHDLLHQMGNRSDEAYLSLHIYGLMENKANINVGISIN